jgi:hypothetical protein
VILKLTNENVASRVLMVMIVKVEDKRMYQRMLVVILMVEGCAFLK